MQNNYEKIFKATVKIEANDSNGTGFHFIDNKTIITNAHVIESAIKSGCKIHAKIGNNRFELNPISIINDDVNDFAILRSTINFPDDRELLQVAEDDDYRIGTEVVFSGFPHGFDDLILQRAIIAGHYNDNHNNFYLDGSVNGGNSGGPIIDYLITL